MNQLRVAFIGQNEAVTLQPLAAVAAQYQLIGIVESALRRDDESLQTQPTERDSALARTARSHGVPFFFLRRTGHAALTTFLRALQPDLICVASMSQLLRPEALSVPPLGAINFHPSLLPKYRGPNPWFWQYYEMESQGGVTIHFLDSGEDTGDLIFQEAFPIALGMPYAELHDRAVAVGTRLLVQAADRLARGDCPRMVQRHLPCPLRARRVRRDEPLIAWEAWSLERTWHVLRGTADWLDPLPPPPGGTAACRWNIGNFARENVPGLTPGTVARDAAGYYIGHREGKIRLSVSESPGRDPPA